ncbi:MAG: hypothetical protein Kow0098_18180 [Ignavibacteriaceae bacterium]
MSRIENHFGISVHSSNLRIVGLTSGEEGIKLSLIEQIPLEEQINFRSDTKVKLSATLQTAIDKLSLSHKLNPKSVSFTLPGYLFLTANLPYDNTLLQQDLEREFKWEFSVLFPFVKQDDLVLRFYETKKNNFFQSNIAIVTAIERKFLLLLEELCVNNNFKFRYVDHSHFASDLALCFSGRDLIRGFTLSLYFEDQFFTISVNLDGLPVWFRGFGLDRDNFNPDDIFYSLKNQAPFRLKKELIENCFIAGDNIPDQVTDKLSDYFSKEPLTFNPFLKITPDKNVASGNYFRKENFLFTSAAGIAYRIS